MNDDVLIAFLLSFPGVKALVESRGYPYGVLPQKRDGQISGELPAFTVNNISESSHHSSSLSSGRPELDCFQPMRFQIDLYGYSGADVVQLGHAIRHVLDGFNGKMSDVLIGGVWRRTTTPLQRRPENELFHRSMDFEIHTMSG